MVHSMRARTILEAPTITLDDFFTKEEQAQGFPLLHVIYPLHDWEFEINEIISENEYEVYIRQEWLKPNGRGQFEKRAVWAQ